jgi:hypothetical protein
MRKSFFVTALLVFLAAAACKKAPDPVQETLDRLVKAANERDAAAVMESVAADFEAADGSTRAGDEALLHRLFAAYEILSVKFEDVRIERAENTARVRLRAVMSGQPLQVGGLSGLLPTSSRYDFDLRMSRDGQIWRVSWASWTPAP